MTDLLGEVDTNIPSKVPTKTIKTASRRKTRVLSPPVSQEKKVVFPNSNGDNTSTHLLHTPPSETLYDDNPLPQMTDDYDAPMSNPLPSSPITKAVERKGQQSLKKEEEDDDIMEIAQVAGDHNVKTAIVNMSGARPAPKIVKKPPYPSPESSSPPRPPADTVDPSTWNDLTSKLNVISSQGTDNSSYGKMDIQNVTEDDGSLRMFWTDYTEVNGSLCLFGKVKDRKTGFHASTFIKVDNVLRKLYFLPRTYRQRQWKVFAKSGFQANVFQATDVTLPLKLRWETCIKKLTRS